MPSFLLIFSGYVILEIYALVRVSSWLGGLGALLALGLSVLLGSWILQHNRAKIMSGRTPRALAIVFSSLAGVLFIIPGFISDGIALLLLLPQIQARLGRASDRFFMRQGFNRLFRFGYFGNMDFSGQGWADEPEFREDIEVTVIDREGGRSTEHMRRRKRIDDSAIIDVEPDEKK